MNIRIYVAGPISLGNYLGNVRAAIDAAQNLRGLGFYPFVPHCFMAWELVYPRNYEDWMAQCLEWVGVCHGLLRIPGDSRGADREVARAFELNIPVFLRAAEAVSFFAKDRVTG